MRRLPIVLAALGLGAGAVASEPVEIELTSGEQIRGVVIDRSETTLRVDHAIFGELILPLDAIIAIDGAPPAAEQAGSTVGDLVLAMPESSIDVEAAAEPASDAPAEVEVVVASPAALWTRHVEFGINARAGTTDDQAVRMACRAERAAEDNLFRLDATYRYNAVDGNSTENRVTAGLFSEWPARQGPLGAFVEARFDHAEFQPWDERVTSAGGLSYLVLDLAGLGDSGEPYDLAVVMRTGGGVRKEFGTTDEEFTPEALLGGELAWQLNPRQIISANATYYPNVEDIDDFRVVSRVDWTLEIDQMDGVSLKLGMAHEHQSSNEVRESNDDLSVYATLVFGF